MDRLKTTTEVGKADDRHPGVEPPHDFVDDALIFETIEAAPAAKRGAFNFGPTLDFGKVLAAHPLATAMAGVAAGIIAIGLLDLLTGRGKRRSDLEQSALRQLRQAQRLDPYGDPLL